MTIQCQVWWARPAVQTPRLIALLDDIERERHDAYRQAVDRARFLTGRVVAKYALGSLLGADPGSVVLDSTCPDCGRTHGKPRIVAPAGAHLEMSISHSGDLVGVAVTAGLPVGIDVEQERDVEVDGLVRMTLSPAEQSVWAAVPPADRDAAFFTYWSRKEAILKATGRGLAVAMTKVTVTPWDQDPRVLESQASEVDPARMRLAQLDPGSGYRACVAVIATEPLDVTVHDADPVVAGLS